MRRTAILVARRDQQRVTDLEFQDAWALLLGADLTEQGNTRRAPIERGGFWSSPSTGRNGAFISRRLRLADLPASPATRVLMQD